MKKSVCVWKGIEQNANLNYNLAKKVEGKYAGARNAISEINKELEKAKNDKIKSGSNGIDGKEIKETTKTGEHLIIGL